MTKYTTRQVAKRLGITKQRIHSTLVDYPALRPVARTSNTKYLLWSTEEIAALQTHIEFHPFKRHASHSRKGKSSVKQTEPPTFIE